VIVVALAMMGCSTKKFVRQTVAPIETRTAALEKKTTDHGGQIEELGTKLSATDERAISADSRAQAAGLSADKAQQTAEGAANQAMAAHTLAQKGMDRSDEVERTLSAKVENMDNYKLLSTSTVLFGLDKSELTMEAKAQLDAEVRKIGSNQHFVIEVQGFTDKTGPARYNLQLSRERANSVVRYLTTTGKIPLYRIQLVGYGSEEPVADNSTRQGREENRRVEVKLFGAGMSGMGTEQASVADEAPIIETEPVSPETGNP
jgi:outer membrane protein OmpA-like peptidoglycan-associated protein